MALYYRIVNLDKKEYLSPQAFGDRSKLLEFAQGYGVMLALAVLLADPGEKTTGDFRVEENDLPVALQGIVGSWSGCRLVITGNSASTGRFVPEGEFNLYEICSREYEDVSKLVLSILCYDAQLKKIFVSKSINWSNDDNRLPANLKQAHEKAKREFQERFLGGSKYV